MNWSLYRWTWLLEAPLFIGAPPAGAFNRCRLYVPARAVWGAMTAEKARGDAGDAWPDYKGVGGKLRDNARFTYLFPAVQMDGEWVAWLPEYKREMGLVWRPEGRDGGVDDALTDRRFRQRLITTRPGTAIDPGTDSAAAGSLRETECLSPRWCSPDGEEPSGPVALCGYVFLRGEKKQGFVDGATTLFLGGDTRYGLGKVRLAVCQEADEVFGEPAML
ncbi:MAG: hypothetical protein RQ767_04130, partial [Thermovirgaceae bacterium]|nr:hypothetical protein [Thermovirgaceae bacterium]